jgi:hypothetical protein
MISFMKKLLKYKSINNYIKQNSFVRNKSTNIRHLSTVDKEPNHRSGLYLFIIQIFFHLIYV